MKKVIAASFVLLMFGCVEKNYTPEEVEAQGRGNTYHWIYNKGMGIEVPSGWTLLKGFKMDYYRRVTGGADYVIVRSDNDEGEMPLIGIRLDDIKVILGRDSIRDQVAIKESADKVMWAMGINSYNLSSLNYDYKNNIFSWSADYKVHTKQYMYDGLSPLEQLDMEYAGYPRYKDVTTEIYIDKAHFFVDRYEIQVTLVDGVSYFADKPIAYKSAYDDDFNTVINSIKFK